MLDHLFISVSDLGRSIAFYGQVLPILGIVSRHDYDGKDGPADHPDLKGFGANGRIFFWLREGPVCTGAVHVGFVAESQAMVNLAHAEALMAGATEIHPPGRSFIMTPLLCGTGQRSRWLQP